MQETQSSIASIQGADTLDCTRTTCCRTVATTSATRCTSESFHPGFSSLESSLAAFSKCGCTRSPLQRCARFCSGKGFQRKFLSFSILGSYSAIHCCTCSSCIPACEAAWLRSVNASQRLAIACSSTCACCSCRKTFLSGPIVALRAVLGGYAHRLSRTGLCMHVHRINMLGP